MLRSSFLAGVGSAVLTAPCAAGTASDLARYMAPHVAMGEFNGIVATAGRHRTTLAAFGGRHSGSTRFRVGSLAKTVTAATVDGLVRAGKLRLDSKLGSILAPFSASTITIEQLLGHTAGVPDIYSLPAFARGHRERIARDDYIGLLAAAKPDFAPGTKSTYSNSGFALLAFAVEAVTDGPFADAQRRYVLDPVGLANTGVLPDARVLAGADPGLPNLTRPAEPLDPSWLIGNGSLYSTSDDILRWLAAVRTGTLVRTRSWPYPWGWGRTKNGQVLDGDGRYAGYASDALLDLTTGDAVVVLSAVQSAVVNVIARDAFASIGGAPLRPAAIRSFVDLDARTAAGYAGSYSLSSDFTLAVRAFGERIQIAGPDGVFEALDPLGSDRFYFRVLDTALVFRREAGGAVTAIDWGPGAFRLSRSTGGMPTP